MSKVGKNFIWFLIVFFIPSVLIAGTIEKKYTNHEDFNQGTLIALEHDTDPNQLQLTERQETLPFIWIANSDESTVSKIDTETGNELGRYKTSPGAGNPSRTTVDLNGDLWVGNRNTNTAVKFALYPEDLNGDGVVTTSRDENSNGVIDPDEVLPWGEDEARLIVIDPVDGGPRALAVDAHNNGWIGGLFGKNMRYYDGQTGEEYEDKAISIGRACFGALIDGQGTLWVANQNYNSLTRIDNPTSDTPYKTYKEANSCVYGLGIDFDGYIYTTGYMSNKLRKLDPNTNEWVYIVSCGNMGRGVAVGLDGDIWVAQSNADKVTRHRALDGVEIAAIDVGDEPTGVAVDSMGKIWVSNKGSSNVMRIDPDSNTVDPDFTQDNHPGAYNYSDMTGMIARNITSKTGTWTVDFDSENEDTSWEKISWAGEGTSILVRVQSSTDDTLWSDWEDITSNDYDLTTIPDGRFLKIEVTMQAISGNEKPILYELTVYGEIEEITKHKIFVIPHSREIFEGEEETFTLSVDEWLLTEEFTVKLLSTDVIQGGLVDPNRITFTPPYDFHKTFTIKAIDDFIDDDDTIYEVILEVDNPNYYLDTNRIQLKTKDNDTAGIIIDPDRILMTSEDGSSDTFTIRLNSMPQGIVRIKLEGDDTEGILDPNQVYFDFTNWDIPIEVKVKGIDDDIDDDNETYYITWVADADVDLDEKYHNLEGNIPVKNIDNDTPGITVTQTDLETKESGNDANVVFSIILNTEPTAEVIINLQSKDETEGVIDFNHIIFLESNWNVPQFITVFGQNDDIDDDDVTYRIEITADSFDSVYDAIDPDDVSVTNIDDDTAGIKVELNAPNVANQLVTSEAELQASFTVVLLSEPIGSVDIGFTIENVYEGELDLSKVSFDPNNWFINRTITVTGLDDFIKDGDKLYKIFIEADASDQSKYYLMDPNDVSVLNLDDDIPGVSIIPAQGSEYTTTEFGGETFFDVKLNTEPSSDVTITFSSTDETEGVITLPVSVSEEITFTPNDWDINRTITVTGIDDAIDDGDIPYSIIIPKAESNDSDYSNINPPDISLTNIDNDTAGIKVELNSQNGKNYLETSEAGLQASFTVVLLSEPICKVDIGLFVEDGYDDEGALDPNEVSFDSSNWWIPRIITVTGIDDDITDGDVKYQILTGEAVVSNANSKYHLMDPNDVSVLNIDNEIPGVSITLVSGYEGKTTEYGDATFFDVVLNTKPSSDVTITFSSDDNTEGITIPAEITFTQDNWNQPQRIKVIGVDDDDTDGNKIYNIIPEVNSSDPYYNGIKNVSNVSLTNLDNDSVEGACDGCNEEDDCSECCFISLLGFGQI